jgi:hypothetical protein
MSNDAVIPNDGLGMSWKEMNVNLNHNPTNV